MFDLFDTSQAQIDNLIEAGALFVVNHSGGKDSQAMLIELKKRVPWHQLLIIHAHLEGMEWRGTFEQVTRYAGNIPVIKCRATKTFFDMVRHRGMFPSPSYRQCTSDLKRGPINREIRRFLAAHPEYGGRIVNCTGIRAQESARRAKQIPFKRYERGSVAGRDWYDWMPIFDYSKELVFRTIRQAGEEPHFVYGCGMSRFSCCFCIMSSEADLKTAARLNPELHKEIAQLEREVGHTMMMPKKGEAPRPLPEITGIAA